MLEVLVVGGGIAGFAVALALWERGAGVTVLEATRPGGEATGAAAGMLAGQYEARGADPLFWLCVQARASYGEFAQRIEELSGHTLGIRWDGLLVANFDPAEHEAAERSAAWQRDAGLEAELLEPGRAQELQTGVSSAVESYLWLPAEGQVDAQRLAAALGDAIARTGIRLIAGNRVERILSQRGSVAGVEMVDGRTLEADKVVVAAGAWSGQLSGLPRVLPVRPVRGQMLRFPGGEPPLRRIVASHAGRYVVPRADGTALAGSTMEEVGFDRSITQSGLDLIQADVGRLVPALGDLRSLERWSGLRPLSEDGKPILGPDPELAGLLYATGYGRDGILIAPHAGAIVADLALLGAADFDWRPFRPDRFSSSSRGSPT